MFYLVVILLHIFAKLCSTDSSSTLDCSTLKPDACKNGFGGHYESSFKRLHLTTLNTILITHIDAYEDLLKTLPQDSKFRYIVDEKVSQLKNLRQPIINESKDSTKLYNTINKVLPSLTLNTTSVEAREEEKYDFEKLVQKYDLEATVDESVFRFMLDIGNIWIELFSKLRDEDLDYYPEYAELNDYMRELARDFKDPGKLLVLAAGRNKAAEFFKLPYLKNIDGAF